MGLEPMKDVVKVLVSPLNLLLIFIPVALAAQLLHWPAVAVFVTAALAVVPLSGILGDATEELSVRAGERVGALINATLGNAAELIITLLALREGLFELVRASVVGSIIGNLLLVAGVSVLLGGLKHGTQKFNRRDATMNATLMLVSAVVLSVPSLFAVAIEPNHGSVESLSLMTAGVIMVLYLLNLIFGFRNNPKTTHYADPGQIPATHTPRLGVGTALVVLAITTVFIAMMSEFLVGAVGPMVAQIGISEFVVGIILVPIIGNVAENVVAVDVALKNKMDLAMGIAVGSSLQIALFVAPLLVFISALFGRVLPLEFNRFEMIALIATCLISAQVSSDGETNWLEGAVLLGLYAILAVAFFYLPVGAVH